MQSLIRAKTLIIQIALKSTLLCCGYSEGTEGRKATGRRSQTHAAALPGIINSSRGNVFMHAQGDLFHPEPKARWQHSSAESPLSSTGSLRARRAKWGRRVQRSILRLLVYTSIQQVSVSTKIHTWFGLQFFILKF